MTLPTYFDFGSLRTSTAGGTVAWPVGHLADDIGILVVQTANETVATPSGWTQISLSPQGTGAQSVAGSTGVAVFWKRATSAAEADVTLADTGDHQIARIYVFRGCDTGAAPIEAAAGGTVDTADTAVALSTGSSTVADCLAVAVLTNATDTSSSQTSGWANSALASVTVRNDKNAVTGVGGGITVVTGEKAVAGALGTWTATLLNASLQAYVTFALRPLGAGGGGGGPTTVTQGGLWIGTGVRETAGVVDATTLQYQLAVTQGRMMIALKPPVSAPTNHTPTLETILDKTVQATVSLGFVAVGADPDGDTLSYSLLAGDSDVPSGATLDSATGEFEWTPDATQLGTWNLMIQVSDGTLTATRTFNITVVPFDPVASAVDVATRAQVDMDSAKALAELVRANEQNNAAVLDKLFTLMADIQTSLDYMQGVIDDQQTPDSTDDTTP